MMTELLKVQVEHNCQAYAQEALNSHTLWSQEVNKGCWDMDAFVCQVAAADGALCDVCLYKLLSIRYFIAAIHPLTACRSHR